ncbi:putative RNA-directed DNA polymerase [Tanacetum coccineum]
MFCWLNFVVDGGIQFDVECRLYRFRLIFGSVSFFDFIVDSAEHGLMLGVLFNTISLGRYYRDCSCQVSKMVSCLSEFQLEVSSLEVEGPKNGQVLRITLQARNKYGFVDGSCLKESYATSDVLSAQWDRCNAIILTWIMNVVSQDIYMGSREFDALTKLPKSSYDVKCSCDASKELGLHQQLMKLMQFLMGLDDCYQPVRSSLLTRDPLLEVKDAYNVISREESHRGVPESSGGTESKQNATSFVAKTFNNSKKQFNNNGNNFTRGTSSNANRGPNPNLNCKHYGKIGHTIDRCFEIVGFPQGFKRNFNSNSNTGKQSFNANSDVKMSDKSSSSSLSSGFTSEQIQKLLNLINDNLSMTTITLGWIIDFGANQHLTGSTSGMINVVDISDLKITVGHPNGQSNMVMNFHVSKLLWHNRLGHPADQVLSVLKKDLNIFDNTSVPMCEICQKDKQTREPFPLSDHKSKSLGELVHLDLWGPYRVHSREGYRYFLTIIDDYSTAVWVYLVKTKDEVFDVFVSFLNLIHNHFNIKVKTVRSDNGTEFINKKMFDMFSELGIFHQTSCSHTPQQNGIAERKHRHLINVTRSLMFQGGIPLRFWSDCVLTVVYLINRLPSSVLNGKSPYEDMKFYENLPQSPYDDGRDSSNKEGSLPHTDSQDSTKGRNQGDRLTATQIDDQNWSKGNTQNTNQSSPTQNNDDVQTPVLRRSERQSKLSVRLNDYVLSSNVKYGIEKYVNYSKLSRVNMCFATSLNKSVEPTCLSEALSDPNWVEAMNNEIKALNRNNTWTICDLPIGRKPIGSKWLWKIKYKASGDIERYKARLVAKGYSQREGFDYDETFSLVVKMVTIRCLIALGVVNNWPLFQLDMNNAFLYGDLLEDVYMTLPEGYNNENNTKSKFDYSLYTKHNGEKFIALLVYVDDIVITGNDNVGINDFKVFLSTKFMIKDLGVLKYFLGIEVVENDIGLCMSQRKYCLELLHEYGLLVARTVDILY